jgi:hypothetical protein
MYGEGGEHGDYNCNCGEEDSGESDCNCNCNCGDQVRGDGPPMCRAEGHCSERDAYKA